jgi:3-phosphoshikimate 1-carboxyvinyltransferase
VPCRCLGATVDLAPDADGNLAGTVTGPLREADDVLDCGNAGTGLRLLAGVVAGIDGLAVLTGDASLRRRPMGRVVQPLRLMGAEIDGRDGGSRPPLTIRGGRLAGITWESSIASAQVKSALLLAGLAATGPTTVVSPARSRDHTERLLRHLGVDVGSPSGVQGPEIVTVVPGPLRGDRIEVSGDPSSAAFWLVAAAIAGTEVRLPGVCVNPRRTGVIEVLRALGADVSLDNQRDVCGEPVADLVVAGASAGTAGTAGASLGGRAEVAGELVVDAIDELPVLAVAGALSAGGLEVRDAAELRVKESDRIDGIERVGQALGRRGDRRARRVRQVDHRPERSPTPSTSRTWTPARCTAPSRSRACAPRSTSTTTGVRSWWPGIDRDDLDGRTFLDGEDVEDEIRGPEVTAAVSARVRPPGVRTRDPAAASRGHRWAAWSRVATSARWCCPTPTSRSSSPPRSRNAPAVAPTRLGRRPRHARRRAPERDAADAGREVAPLVRADDAGSSTPPG